MRERGGERVMHVLPKHISKRHLHSVRNKRGSLTNLPDRMGCGTNTWPLTFCYAALAS